MVREAAAAAIIAAQLVLHDEANGIKIARIGLPSNAAMQCAAGAANADAFHESQRPRELSYCGRYQKGDGGG